MKKKCVLTVAGSDSSGGAGIQADLKTMSAFGVYGMSAITSLTAQNTTGVYGILDCTPEMLKKQLDCVFEDIYPDAVKIGMVSSAALIETIAEALRRYGAKNIVLDPVMVSTSGSRLLAGDAIDALVSELFPLASLITPNIPEAEALGGMKIEGQSDMERAAELISEKYGVPAVLVKGGHNINDANDLLYERAAGTAAGNMQGCIQWFCGMRIENENTHGTGCTLSSAIACGLAKGYSMKESIAAAKAYISGALKAGLDLGSGSGPLWHMWEMI
ncbi:MAG: bifunctional hydroxymethylpyrimidine kinase/phosphomethylpyrimidine kinase [Lachnospiraceae bacterium]|nr:bifunctional hydroxymethylpyrimidine kinase/phosphomethylpyrimidine kinase [Lachnospiraceae bacterium]